MEEINPKYLKESLEKAARQIAMDTSTKLTEAWIRTQNGMEPEDVGKAFSVIHESVTASIRKTG